MTETTHKPLPRGVETPREGIGETRYDLFVRVASEGNCTFPFFDGPCGNNRAWHEARPLAHKFVESWRPRR